MIMNTKRWLDAPRIIAPFGMVAVLVALSATAHAIQNDRIYRMGESEGGINGSSISVTFDDAGVPGMSQLHDLVPSASPPVYRSYTGRPDGNNSLGVELNGSNQFLRSARFGLPDTTVSSVQSITLNYSGLVNRGLQFWVRPGATTAQTMVMDTNQHGARINASGNFSMRYAGVDYDSTTSASAGTWYHVMVVRPNGADNGAQMYVNGNAVIAAAGGYDGTDTAELVVGANTAGDDGADEGVGFTGGTEEFFNGIIDDLKLFVIGESNEFAGPPVEPGVDFGDFNFATDNDFAANILSGVPGDLDNNGSFQAADRTAFINGWMNEKEFDGARAGDLSTFAAGDLNFDGITDIRDLVAFQALLPVAGLSAITAAELTAVPEPSTAILLLTVSLIAPNALRRHRRRV